MGTEDTFLCFDDGVLHEHEHSRGRFRFRFPDECFDAVLARALRVRSACSPTTVFIIIFRL
jgi:hypothetical protein